MSVATLDSANTVAHKSDTQPIHRILIITASMGAGHDGAARELESRLIARGHVPHVEDFLGAFPIGIGWFFRWLYGRMLALAPWTYDALYKVFPSLYTPFSFLEHHITRRSLRRWVRTHRPDVIVSTYPLASLALGRMRSGGKLSAPVITYITDFHAHQLVTHEGVDLHLALHDVTKREAVKRITGAVNICAPLVSSRFAKPSEIDLRASNELDIANDQTMVLVVAGSWGAGEVEETVRDIVESGDVVPVVICGKNADLFERVSVISHARAVGWTNQMAELMAAADVLIDNAGGLTAMEALAAGLPIINYRPLAGHGRDNAMDMQTAGVVNVAHDIEELKQAIEVLGADTDARRSQIANGKDLFAIDATDDVLAYAAGKEVPLADVVSIAHSPRAKRSRKRRASMLGVAALVVSLGMTTGVGEATAHGLGTDKGDYRDASYIGVRVTGDELADNGTLDLLKRLPVSVVVDGQTAATSSAAIHELCSSGVPIANGGSGRHDPGWTPWSRARLDLEQGSAQVGASTGVAATTFIPSRRLDSFDLLYTRRLHMHAIPTAKIVKPGHEQQSLANHGAFVVDGRGESVDQFRARLATLESIDSAGSDLQPLTAAGE